MGKYQGVSRRTRFDMTVPIVAVVYRGSRRRESNSDARKCTDSQPAAYAVPPLVRHCEAEIAAQTVGRQRIELCSAVCDTAAVTRRRAPRSGARCCAATSSRCATRTRISRLQRPASLPLDQPGIAPDTTRRGGEGRDGASRTLSLPGMGRRSFPTSSRLQGGIVPAAALEGVEPSNLVS